MFGMYDGKVPDLYLLQYRNWADERFAFFFSDADVVDSGRHSGCTPVPRTVRVGELPSREEVSEEVLVGEEAKKEKRRGPVANHIIEVQEAMVLLEQRTRVPMFLQVGRAWKGG